MSADRLSEEYVRLSSYMAINRLAMEKILKKHDKHAPLPFHDLFPVFADNMANLLPTSFFDTHVLGLSDFYAQVRGETIDKVLAPSSSTTEPRRIPPLSL